jgi:hypothetical protein
VTETPNTLQRAHNVLATLGYACIAFAVVGANGAIPGALAVTVGLVGVLVNGLAASPIFSPSAEKTTLLDKVLVTFTTVSALVSASSYFEAVQKLMAPGHAQRLASFVLFLGQFASRLAQSRLIPSGALGAGPPVLGLVLAFFVGGCAHAGAVVESVVHDVEVCAGPACADAAKRAIPKISEIIMCDAMAGSSPAALPACATAALADWAKDAGPDGWRIIGCVVDALERDATRPPELRARARAARPLAARMANGR